MKELPDLNGPLSDRSQSGSESVNCLVNPHTITYANIENGFGGNEEDEKCGLYH